MKVAIYYPWVYLPGGPERTIAELLSRSRHDWTVITNRYERDATFPVLQNARIIELPRVSVNRSMSHVFRAGFRIALQKLPLEGQAALVVFCEGLGDFTLFRNHSVPAACLCFTPLRAAFDEHYASRYLERAGNTFGRRAMLAAASFLFRRIDRFLWHRYQRVFAISKEVRRRIVAGGLRAEADIDLLYPGVDTGRLVPTWQYNREFVIPGRIMWTKNLEIAIDAFRLLQSRRPDLVNMRLTIAGWVDQKSEEYAKALKERAAGSPGIRFAESPSDAELFGLCQSCLCVLYPAFNEDWGLVPLESMAFGKPVIAVNRGGPEETVVDGVTGYLVDPTPEAFAGAMERLADDPELVRRLGAAARPRAELFDWARFAEKLDRQVDQLVSARARSGERACGFAGRNAEYGGES
jgi:glycosyltransferase involved in cell wall biosynthesis